MYDGDVIKCKLHISVGFLSTRFDLRILSRNLSLEPDETAKLLPRRLNSHNLRQAVTIKCQMLCGVYPTNTCLAKTGKRHSTLCHCSGKEETITHLLGECHHYTTERANFISKLPESLQQELSCMPVLQQPECITNLILLGSDDHLDGELAALPDHHNLSLSFLKELHAKRSSFVYSTKI